MVGLFDGKRHHRKFLFPLKSNSYYYYNYYKVRYSTISTQRHGIWGYPMQFLMPRYVVECDSSYRCQKLFHGNLA